MSEYEDSEAARYDLEKAAHDDEMEQRELLALRERVDHLEAALREIADGVDGEYVATSRGIAIARAALEGK